LGYLFSFLVAKRPREEVYPMTIWGRWQIVSSPSELEAVL
jgi:hypothetical protein